MDNNDKNTSTTEKVSSHHHHHHHRRSFWRRLKDWYTSRYIRNTFIIFLLVVTAFTLIIGIAVFMDSHKKDIEQSLNNYSYVRVNNNKISCQTNNGTKIHFAYGHLNDFSEKNCIREYTSSYCTYTAEYNCEYTIFVEFRDGGTKLDYVNITANAVPLALSQREGKIFIESSSMYNINSISYNYGLSMGNPYVDWKPLNKGVEEMEAVSNGWHTFKISATSARETKTYYQCIYVDTVNRPSIVVDAEGFVIYTYGYECKTVSYTKGKVISEEKWQTILDEDITYIMPNAKYALNAMDAGKYTFRVETKEEIFFIEYTF